MGMKTGSIIEMPFTNNGKAKLNRVMTSHCDGEVWGLEVVELGKGQTRIITSADDNRLLAYDVKSKYALAEGRVDEVGKKKKDKGGYRGGASTMASTSANCQSRCVAYSAKLKQLAVANNKGTVTIRDVDWDEVDQGIPGSFDKIKKTLFKDLKKAEWIECMAFSPCDQYLAVGSHDNTIYLLDTKTYNTKSKTCKLTGHSSFITALDWALDSSYIRSVCGAYELLFFNAKTKKRDPKGASNTQVTVW